MASFIIYCRKSTESEDRQVLSIESQVNEIRELARKLGISVSTVLTESKSAKAPGRPIFNDMIQRVYRGEVQGILCWKLDRLARNPVDGGSLIWALKQHGLQIITPTQRFSQIEDNTILMYVEFGMAQKYVDDLSRNVKRGLKTKAEKGWCPGLSPLGYLNVVTKSGERQLVMDPDRFHIIRRIWDLMLSGNYSTTKILEIANGSWGLRTRPMRRQGGKPLARSGLYRLLSNPFYYGSFEYPRNSGSWHRGNHEPMITQAEFDRVQILLGKRTSNSPRNTCRFTFSGMIHCGECGGAVTAEEKHQIICSSCRVKFARGNRDQCPECNVRIDRMEKPILLHYVYYHCAKSKNPRCRQRGIETKKLERQIHEFLQRLELASEFRDWALDFLEALSENQFTNAQVVRASQENTLRTCLKHLDGLITLKTAPENAQGNLISNEEYARQRSTLLSQKQSLEDALSKKPPTSIDIRNAAISVFDYADTAAKRFKSGDASTKRAILTRVGSNLRLTDKMLSIEATDPFHIFLEYQKGSEHENDEFEPDFHGSVEWDLERFEPYRPIGLRRQDSNLRPIG